MKKFILFVIMFSLLLGCTQEPAEVSSSAFDVLPDKVLFALALENPEALIGNLDKYLAEIPVLGKNVIANWIFGTIGDSSFVELQTQYGITPNGTFCVFTTSMMPQSFGGAFTVSNQDVFWSAMGTSLQESEPIDNTEVSVSTIPNMGQIFLCFKNNLILFAGSRTLLESMIENIDGDIPGFVPDIPSAGIYLNLDMRSVGPMFAMQLGSLKQMIIEDMNNSPETGMNPEQMDAIIDVYFDLFHIILTETENVDLLLTFGESDITGNMSAMFIPGSTLDSIIVPIQPISLTSLIPAGNVAEARISIAEETSVTLMTAYGTAFGMNPASERMVEFWAACSRNTAMTLMAPTVDNPMHIIAVYELPEGANLSDIKDAYDDQMQMSAEFLASMEGMEITDPVIQSYGGMDWVTFGMEFTAPDVRSSEMYTAQGDFNWTVWLTIHENQMYMEMAENPDDLLQMFRDGVSNPVSLEGLNPDAEVAVRLNIPGYAEMVAALIDSDYVDTEFEPVWLDMEIDIVEGGINKEFSISGIELCRFIGDAMEMFGGK